MTAKLHHVVTGEGQRVLFFNGSGATLEGSAQIARRIAGSDLRIYEGGHLFVVQDPAAMADIEEFVTTS